MNSRLLSDDRLSSPIAALFLIGCSVVGLVVSGIVVVALLCGGRDGFIEGVCSKSSLVALSKSCWPRNDSLPWRSWWLVGLVATVLASPVLLPVGRDSVLLLSSLWSSLDAILQLRSTGTVVCETLKKTRGERHNVLV